ncbi:hypothetical protein [Bacillus sp. USDA818B3_A]|uniref:hypothetical protein n=1 Tax=Bacillus sp. USDA818B3_A TaxID=2698834 RepID=UPI00136C8E37|nr:hypothetical protein [Bacillus sp. USDA818B3_A]
MIFNRNNKKEQPIRDSNEFDKQILRINTLEVQIKKLLEFEKQLRVSMHGTAKGEKAESFGKEQKHPTANKPRPEMPSRNGDERQIVNELSLRMEKLEKKVQGLSSAQSSISTYPLSSERRGIEETQLLRLVEQMVSEKLAAERKKIQQQDEKIRTLEKLISQVINQESIQFSRSIERKIHQPDQDRGTSINRSHEERDSLINMRILALEQNFILVNEVQASLLKRMDELAEKQPGPVKDWEETEGPAIQANPSNYKTLYIDKLYLEKYEQNNNFAQIGIRELSGALNIGATYGKDVIPKKITEQVKADMEGLKAVKEEMEKQQMSTDESDKPQTNESSSDDVTSIPLEEEESFTDIDIEDD